MKGTIVKCMQELVTKKFGPDKWKDSLKNAGLQESRIFTTTEDVTDKDVLAIMKGIATTAALPMDQVMEAFGEYWSTVYAPTIYSIYFAKAKSARELLLSLDQIHVSMTKTIKSAHPPHFQYESKGDKTLIMHYNSSRGMVALMPGLVRGVGKYYKEKLTVSVKGNAVEIQFP